MLRGGKEADTFSAYIPGLIDSFFYQEGGIDYHAIVFERYTGWYSLKEVRQAYPAGIDARDMAWIWRRLLVGLGFAHLNEIIHGAILPVNVRISPKQHGLMLEHWAFAAWSPEISGEQIAAVDPAYAGWYPGEVLRDETPLFGTDIGMAARCMIYLLGGDPESGWLPASAPQPIQAFLKGCTLPGTRARPQDAWSLKEEFDDLLERLWGERKFHPFYMK